MKIDLSKCKRGDVLVGRLGVEWVFVGPTDDDWYAAYQSDLPQHVEAFSGDGRWAVSCRNSSFDIVRVIPKKAESE